MANEDSDDDLDAMLDSALDDFDEAEKKQEEITAEAQTVVQSSRAASSGEGPVHGPVLPPSMLSEGLDDDVTKMMAALQTGDMGKNLEDTLRSLTTDGGPGGESPEDMGKQVETFLREMGTGGLGTGNMDMDTNEFQKNMAKSLEALGGGGGGGGGGGAPDMDSLMKNLEGLGENPAMQGMMEKMMEQLMSKEVLYEPMKHMCNEYPTWMSENREKLSEQEVRNYELQHRYMQEIVNMYDTGAPSATVMDKMQQMQDCGPPPPELLKKLAPGVDIGPDGMPKLQGGMPGGGDGQPCPVQ